MGKTSAQPHLGYGVGLRHCHFDHLLTHDPQVDWFEIISENFMGTRGRSLAVLHHLREKFPVIPHGVSLSIGSSDPLSQRYLQLLKCLANDIDAPYVTDHLCWTGVGNRNVHDLLPLPYTEESLTHVCQRVSQVIDYIDRPLALENPSTYLQFSHSTIDEWEFLAEVHRRTGCGILLDINNVYVSSSNHGFDPCKYIDAIPPESVWQYHLAGHTDKGTYLLDTHIGPTPAGVLKLFQYSLAKIGPRSTLLEWDEDIPSFAELESENHRIRRWASSPRIAERRDDGLTV